MFCGLSNKVLLLYIRFPRISILFIRFIIFLLFAQFSLDVFVEKRKSRSFERQEKAVTMKLNYDCMRDVLIKMESEELNIDLSL